MKAVIILWPKNRLKISPIDNFTVQNYRVKIMQIFTLRYNLEFRKLTFYGLTRLQSIRKSQQISGQTILSSPQDLEFNPNFAKNRDIPVVKNSVTRPVTPAVVTTDTLSTFYSRLIICQGKTDLRTFLVLCSLSL